MADRVAKSALSKMFEQDSLGSPDKSVGFVLWRITARYQRAMDRALAAVDLTHLQFVVLAMVAWFERKTEPISQVELAKFGGIHPMQLSLMLRTLEKKGLLFRARSTEDTRAKRVVLTPDGLKVLRQALPRVLRVQEVLFGHAGRPGGSLHKVLLDLEVSTAALEEETDH